MKKTSEMYRGKTKTVYFTDNPNLLILEFRNEISALDGKHIETFERKGLINNNFNYLIMKKLMKSGIPTHMEQLLSDNQSLVKKLTMIPIECIIRNRAAGSLINRLGIIEGVLLNPPIFDIFLKNDLQHDPMINESYCETFGWVSKENLSNMKQLTYKANKILNNIFDNAGLILVDFKLEFGLFNGQVILGDEFSPDSSRLWDKKTKYKLDKDRFRYGLNNLIKSYEEVANRIGVFI
ncbi:MAG: phosphoribosylaminoimidazolesuccinocarboxamide synthase [Arsenophonus endosymbiont of Ceratovacuna japonica]